MLGSLLRIKGSGVFPEPFSFYTNNMKNIRPKQVDKIIFQEFPDPNNPDLKFRLIYLYNKSSQNYFLRLGSDNTEDDLLKDFVVDISYIKFNRQSPEIIGNDTNYYLPSKLYVLYNPFNTNNLKDVKWCHFEPFIWNDEILRIVDEK